MRTKILLACSCLAIIASILGGFFFLHRPSTQVYAAGNGDWPTYLGDVARTGTNRYESIITPATAASLTYAWKFTTNGYVAASPTIVNGVMYIGSWDGYEYAIDISTHQQIWKQYPGVTHQTKYCYANSVGVDSTATVQNDVVYVGGGDGYMYALRTSDGSLLWKTFLAAPPYYNWSSPLLFNNELYIGLSAFCDPPFVQGKVIALSVSDGSVVASISLVPDGQTGAPVWGSAAVDVDTNTIYVATGNNGSQSTSVQINSEAILALDANTLNVKDRWQIPSSEQVGDSDFGTTPVLFDVNSVPYIGALNKNGIYYVLNRSNLSAGPVWKQVMSGNSQVVDGNNVSPSCYNNGVIYAGSAGGNINGQSYGGSVRAFDAVTGGLLWAANTNGKLVAPVTCTNGLVIDNQGTRVEVRDASNGNILFQFATGKRLYGASVISNGVLYTPSTDGSIYAFVPQGTIFQDNFDSYSPGPLPTGQGSNKWTTVTVTGAGFSLDVSSLQSNSSPNSLRITLGSGLKGNAWVLKKYLRDYPTHAARFRLYLDPGLTFSGQSIGLFNTQNRNDSRNGSISVQLTADHILEVIWYDSHHTKHSMQMGTATRLSSGQWYTIEIDQTNDPLNGSWSLWLNGTQVAAQTTIDMGNVFVNASIAGDKLASTSAMSGSFYEDDILTAQQPIG